jgi:pyruvate/2-oxoglutarate dehydrogenase complex dihydrolipoamide dehydrogenase (E3) component
MPVRTAPPLTSLDEHDRILLHNVHPPEWVNPEPAPRYNLVVIGAGTAGLVCAAGAAGLGARVALIERHLLGGDCLNYGCVPSKGMIRASRAAHEVRNAREFGISCGSGISVDFGVAMERMRRLRSGISLHDSALRFRDELGVDVFFGEARFVGPEAMEVDGKRLHFARAAVCTGARAAAPPIPGLAEAGYLTNETVFSLTKLPSRLAVIGAGPIGSELAQAFARLGSRVSIVGHLTDHILPREDPDAAGIVQDAFAREGIGLFLPARNLQAAHRNGGKVLRFECRDSQQEIEVDEILVGVGRAPNVEGLGLEAAGVAYDARSGVTVDERLRTTNPRVYAAGDICFPFKFTHTADALARILIANALFMGRQRTSALTIPWCTYTDPEIAHVGLYERDAREKGIEVTTLTVSLSDIDRAVLDGETGGFARVHLPKGTDRILGATIVARHAGEMINEFSLAMTNGLGLSAIGRTIHPYPTQAEVIRKLADAYNRTRLTPLIKRVLSGWMAWRRGRP